MPLVLGGLALYVLLPSLLSVFGSWRSLSHLADAEPRRPVSAPERDRFNYDKHSLLAHIMVATGGRAAEEVVYGDERTGAESDIRQATNLARNMVGRFGMSDEIGFLAVLPQDGSGSYPGYSEFSERTRQRIDEEMKRVVGEAYDEAVSAAQRGRERLEALADALFRAETLEEPETYATAGVSAPAEAEAAAEEQAPSDPAGGSEVAAVAASVLASQQRRDRT